MRRIIYISFTLELLLASVIIIDGCFGEEEEIS